MNNEIKETQEKSTSSSSEFVNLIGKKSSRMIKSQKHPSGVWFGLGMMGIIGWSVVVPTLLGAWIGTWLDNRHIGDGHTWTLPLVIGGLCIGFLNVLHWMTRQHQEIQNQEKDNNE